MAITLVKNRTPDRVTLIGDGNERLALAPLQEKEIADASSFDFTEVTRDGIVEWNDGSLRWNFESILKVVAGGGVAVVVAAGMLSGVSPPPFGLQPDTWKVVAWIVPAIIMLA